ncbi:MAG TPA: 4-hydroxy-tetrahydrodipicolinate synthase [Candidatus Avamphibacillus intestinigallinarum]|nr:4-hydroxy-tetrahydrodipicolinate synthase [Candidatus Avamphibacillus intestinigallinarum]
MDFGKVLTAMVTPFNEENQLDLERVTTLVEHLIANGTEGLVVAGTTGETPTLTHDEKIKLIDHVVKVVNKRIPVIAGTGTNDTPVSVELTQEVETLGVDAIMLVNPAYNKPNQRGLYQHFKMIAESTNLPIMLYNIPGRTAVNMTAETTIALSEIDNIVSIKEASGDIHQISKIIENTPDDFSVYCGDDGMTLPLMSIGANGIVSVASHIIGNEINEMVQTFLSGDVRKAAKLHRTLLPTMEAMFIAPSPSPVKAALNMSGIEVGNVRMPLVEIDKSEEKFIKNILF